MTDRFGHYTDPRLERALEELARAVAYPPAPALASSVRAELERAGTRRPVWRLPLRLGLAAAVLVALAVAVLSFSPTAREAVADLLGLSGVDIEVTESPRPAPTPTAPLSGYLDVGDRRTLSAARRAVDFDVVVPQAAGLERPDEIWVSDHPSGGRVTFFYRAGPGLPPIFKTGTGLLMTQFRARLDEMVITKLIDSGATVEPIEVDGSRGYWIDADHPFYLYRTSGGMIEETVRMSDSALLWQDEDVTRRIESALSKREALRIAESAR